MGKLRVLIVDDSVIIRRIISEIVSSESSLEVAGTAANGKIALAKISHLNPDIVTLDMEMPVMNGIETLQEIRKMYPVLPVIMFSTLTERGAVATLEALAAGATDYVTKPSQTRSLKESVGQIKNTLIPKIKAVSSKKTGPRTTKVLNVTGFKKLQELRSRRLIRQSIPKIVAIGVSTGGPNALSKIMPLFPKDFPIPILIVQHMPPVFTKSLADRLNSISKITISEAKDNLEIKNSHAYIAPGNFHITVEKENFGYKIKTNQEPPENSCRPSADVLFRSVAKNFGASSVAVVLTGMGMDGLRGSEHIYEKGGRIIAQDKQSSVVWGMPGAVVKAGFANTVLPLNQITEEIIQIVCPKK